MAKRAPSRSRARPLERRWEPYLAAEGNLAALDRQQLADGYRRAPKVRASLRRGRILTLRFTWSKFLNGIRLDETHIIQLDLAVPKEAIP
ncbi:MAG TPA: hypothetical protein VGF92_02830 [Stellaceae bacterium]|jgi:hypothetical protein